MKMSILHRAFTFLLLLFALTSFASQIMAVGDPCTLPGVQVITDPTGENLTLQDITRGGTEFTITSSP